ncbi:MAG: hypothetical protein KF809_00495 [Chloroflexi bacterium]|nr:hypothetical protein [Chloroflexota bacterium]
MTGSRTVVALVVASVLGLATAITAHAAEPEPEAPRWGLFVDAEREVGSGMVAVDRQDGIHIAYSHRAPLAEDPTAGWLYCPVDAACGSGEGWIGTELGTNVLRVMLATTRVGAPRLLIEQSGTNGGKDYHYAAYDTDCGNPASWQVGFVTRTWGTEIGDAFLETHTRHGFALDDQDRPGFVFDDRDYLREPDHVGGFYTWCETACAAGTPESPTWREVDIGGGAPGDRDIYSLPALRVHEQRSAARPRGGDHGRCGGRAHGHRVQDMRYRL